MTRGPAPGGADFVRALLAWFAASARPLPWRRRRTLFGTWISEIMLQQTTVTAVVPYWERFMERFPDVRSLAAADEAEVLALWSGLGYYGRARRLHAAARAVVADGGALPGNREGWAALPGIGRYTSAAIATQGLGEPAAAIDGNARRVHLRWFAADAAEAEALKPARLEARALELVPADRPGDWTEAVMELGAVVCRPVRPDCGACPVRRWCRAAAAGATASVGAPEPRPAAIPARAGVLALVRGGRVLLAGPGTPPLAAADCRRSRVRDDFSRLHRGLWGLPMTPWFSTEGGDRPLPAAVWRPWPGRPEGATPSLAGGFRHAITRYRLTVEVHVLAWPAGLDPAGQAGAPPVLRFATLADPGLPVSALTTKALRIIQKTAGRLTRS